MEVQIGLQCQRPFQLIFIVLKFLNADTGFVIGQSGTILKTLDGSNTWTSISSGMSGYLYNVNFKDSLTGYIAGDPGILLKTIDGGNSWSILSYNNLPSMNSVAAVNNIVSYSAGYNVTIIKTVNGGLTWMNENSTSSARLLSICFPSLNVGYAIRATQEQY